MNTAAMSPRISVIVPTFNRAGMLEAALESLTNQSVPQNQYEVIVVDDGSTDTTSEVCKRFWSCMNLKYARIENSGISAAKSVGVAASSSPLLLFFDDDDIADQQLLQEHIKTHRANPQEGVAVLGYTTWAPTLAVTPVMEYVTGIGHFLFAYTDLEDGQILDFTYFWGGRSSCKRTLLAKHGVFNQQFRYIIEDIELGYRLSKFGLKVVFNRHAVSYMTRPITFDEFCRRCERQGKALFLFSRLHPDPIVQQYCRIPDPILPHSGQLVNAEKTWPDVKQNLGEKVRRVHEIEELLRSWLEIDEQHALLQELRSLYWWTFNTFKIKGITEARQCGEKVLIR
jgi:cellulose synthase/poly-beta-1,6-N-acetylglucosamine synthase-like glycosyltransferase